MNVTTIRELVTWMDSSGQIEALSSSNMTQFGTPQEPMLGATILPERQDIENAYNSVSLAINNEIGNSGADYSPAQKNKALGDYSFLVKLGKLDAASDLNGPELERIIHYLERRLPTRDPIMSAAEILARWFDRGVLHSLAQVMEQQRWQAIIDGQVKRRGSNGYAENVDYPYGTSHQITTVPSGTLAAPAGWYDPNMATAYNPMLDILAIKQRFADRGFKLRRIISKSAIRTVFFNNGKTRQNALPLNILPLTTSQVPSERDIQAMLDRYELPPWEVYNSGFKYRDPNNADQLKFSAYLDRQGFDPIIFLATTTLEQQIELGRDQGIMYLPSTLGNFVLGRNLGQMRLGKVPKLIVRDEKYPYSIYGEIVATGLPVIEAEVLAMGNPIAILKVPKPTP